LPLIENIILFLRGLVVQAVVTIKAVRNARMHFVRTIIPFSKPDKFQAS